MQRRGQSLLSVSRRKWQHLTVLLTRGNASIRLTTGIWARITPERTRQSWPSFPSGFIYAVKKKSNLAIHMLLAIGRSYHQGGYRSRFPCPASSSPPLLRVYGRYILISHSWGTQMHYAAELCLGCRYPAASPCWFKINLGIATLQRCLKWGQSLEAGTTEVSLEGLQLYRQPGQFWSHVKFHFLPCQCATGAAPAVLGRDHTSCLYEPNLPPGKQRLTTMVIFLLGHCLLSRSLNAPSVRVTVELRIQTADALGSTVIALLLHCHVREYSNVLLSRI